jgi:hypothetical protein
MSVVVKSKKCSKIILTKFKKKLKWYLIFKKNVVYGRMYKKIFRLQ